jgi:hypothetical protein
MERAMEVARLKLPIRTLTSHTREPLAAADQLSLDFHFISTFKTGL